MIGDVLVDALLRSNTTLGVVLQTGDEIDLDPTYGANNIQILFSVLVAVFVIIGSSLFIRYQSSRILDDDEAENSRAITSGLRSRDRQSLRIDSSDDVDDYRDQVRELFEGDHDVDVPSVRQAVAEVVGVFRERRRAASRAVRGEVPALARALSVDGFVYLVFGLIALESVDSFRSIVGASQSPPSPAEITSQVSSIASSATSTLVEIVTSFPFAGELWAFGLVGVIQAGTILYENVLAVALVLLVGSVVIWIGDRLVADDVERRLYRSRPRAVIGIVAVLLATWITGVGVAIVARTLHNSVGSLATGGLVGVLTLYAGRSVVESRIVAARDAVAVWKERQRLETAVENAVALDEQLDDYHARRPSTPSKSGSNRWSKTGFPIESVVIAIMASVGAVGVSVGVASTPIILDAGVWGATVGLLASVLVFGSLSRVELRRLLGRLSAAHEQADEHGVGKTGTVAYISARKVFGLLGATAGLILPIYIFQAVVTGKLAALLTIATTESSTQVRATLLLVALVLVAFIVIQTRPAWGDLSDAIRYAADRQGLKLALKSRGFPVLVVVLAFVMILGSGFFGPLEALVLAIILGLVVRAFFFAAGRAEFAYARFDRPDRKPGRVFVEAVVVEDARGREIAVAKENDHRVAAPVDRVDELVEQILDDTKSLFAESEPEPSVFEYYADRIEDGKVDFDAVLSEYRGSISTKIDVELEKAGRDGIDVERLNEIMTDRFDREMYLEKRREKRRKADGIVITAGKVRRN